MQDKVETALGWIVSAVLIVGGIAWASSDSPQDTEVTQEPVCTKQVIPYQTERQSSELYDLGTEKVRTAGVNGTRELCTKDGIQVSDNVLYEPTNEVIAVGTYVKPVPIPQTYSSCPITTCNDGWCSSSTGRGTCSHHGGIAY